MRAVVYEGSDDLRLEEVPEPVVLEPEDAVVRVTTASIFGMRPASSSATSSPGSFTPWDRQSPASGPETGW
jgi:hypothetical protein